MTDDKTLIEARVREYIEAFNARDIGRVMACYDADAVAMLVPDQLLTSTDQIKAGVLESFEGGFTAAFEAIETMVAGNVALSIVQGTVRGTMPDGNPIELKNRRSIDVLRRQTDGSWLVAIDDGPGVDLFPPAN